MQSPDTIIGRSNEKKLLEKLYCSKEAEFVAIYGRRRVGKTYLVRNYFKNKGIFFEVTGSINAKTKEQLENFHTEYTALFPESKKQPCPKTWREAFSRLKASVEAIGSKQKIVLFFDELPWLASPKSGFLSALDYAWNRHFSTMSNILLIVSGSAASWMINHVVDNTGGLYGRLSANLRLLPFNLKEVEEYLLSKDIQMTRKQICEVYMVTGGVPKYLSYIEKGMSSSQNIQQLCFTPQAPLLTEFHKLYHSLFQNGSTHLKITKTLAAKRRGMTRTELLQQAKLANGGSTQQVLKELEESGFIASLPELGKKTRDSNYYLNDEYTLFYLHWIEPAKGELLRGVESDYWIKRQASPSWKSWAGFSFENLCMKHIPQIKAGLQIGGISSVASYWKSETSQGKKLSEIDLVIDRADQCINLCEIKFCHDKYILTKAYAQDLDRKKALFQEATRTKKGLFTTLITPYGAQENDSFLATVDYQLTQDALFHNS